MGDGGEDDEAGSSLERWAPFPRGKAKMVGGLGSHAGVVLHEGVPRTPETRVAA